MGREQGLHQRRKLQSDEASSKQATKATTEATTTEATTTTTTTTTTPHRLFKKPAWSSAVRNLAIWRMIFFCIMAYEYGNPMLLPPFGSLDLYVDMTNKKNGFDRVFSYQQFQWLQTLHAAIGDSSRSSTTIVFCIQQSGYVLATLAAFGKELRLPGWRWYTATFTTIYSIQFWSKATNFTNHNYLFALLMVITTFSGGGHISGYSPSLPPRHSANNRRNTLIDDSKYCNAAIVALRAQFAVVYGFASLWKIHPDWFTGRCVRCIFMSFEEKGQARGISWSGLEERFPPVFCVLAVSGFVLDSGMFAVLFFAAPRASTRNLFLVSTVLFHVFTSITMGQMIGYSFPATCIAGLVLFLPLCHKQGGANCVYYDRSLVSWLLQFWSNMIAQFQHDDGEVTITVKRKPAEEQDEKETSPTDNAKTSFSATWQQTAALIWVAWQILLPLRMPIVSSGNYPMNRLGYRYSWTMMLHSSNSAIVRRHPNDATSTVLLLNYLVPTCFQPEDDKADLFMPRTVYMSSSEHPMEDSRTLPLRVVLEAREDATLQTYPLHFIASVANGFCSILDEMAPNACRKQIPNSKQNRIGAHAVYFSQLNRHGPFSRLVNPMLNLIHTTTAQDALPVLVKWWNSFWDVRPHDFVLSGIGSMRNQALLEEEKLRIKFPEATINMIADRAACLQPRPLWLRPMGYDYVIAPLILPDNVSMMVRSAVKADPQNPSPNGNLQYKINEMSPFQQLSVQTIELEIGLAGYAVKTQCGETTAEDVLFAILYF